MAVYVVVRPFGKLMIVLQLAALDSDAPGDVFETPAAFELLLENVLNI